jgi:hypothetical protein
MFRSIQGLGAAYLLWAMAAALLPAAEVYTYWIQPCTQDVAARSGCEAADPELALWALEAWQKAAGPGLRFVPAGSQNEARVRIYWLGERPQLYGEARPIYINGQRGASIEVQPDPAQLGPQIADAARNDKLFRDTIVYLTCLHETGHGIGLEHTASFADIMYSFQYGGDVLAYFNRYRRMLKERPDIRTHAGISEADRARAASRYASPRRAC